MFRGCSYQQNAPKQAVQPSQLKRTNEGSVLSVSTCIVELRLVNFALLLSVWSFVWFSCSKKGTK